MSRITRATAALLLTAAIAHGAEEPPTTAPPTMVYAGCAEVDTITFPLVVDFFAPFTAEQCLAACPAASHVAVGSGCICSEPELAEPKFTLVDEAKCDRVCIEDDENSGICGGDGVFSVYELKTGGDPGDGGDGDYDEDCTTDVTPTGTATAEPTDIPTGTKTASDIVTVTSCPEEVEDCPYRPTGTPPPTPCKGNETCHTGAPKPPCDTCGDDDDDSSPEPTDVPVEAGAVARGTMAFSAVALGLLAFAMV